MANLSKSQITENINSEINDNITGQISPHDIRHNLIDIIDSVNNLIDPELNLTIADLISNNFSTPSTRSVKIGLEALDKLDLPNYTTTDDTAVGYQALYSSYQGSGNTALGASALSCNIYGVENAAIGRHALTGNINGYGNVGVGSHSLSRNKNGNWNIAIGQGAGYYAPTGTDYKLYIGSHAVDHSFVCSNPEGTGLTPLVYGDLTNNNLILGVGTRGLHSKEVGTLQTSGNISPSMDRDFNLGHSSYYWDKLYLSHGIIMSGSALISSESLITQFVDYDPYLISSGDFVPFGTSQTYDLGHGDHEWKDLWTKNANISSNVHIGNNLTVSGITELESFVATQQSHYLTKTIHLASSGTFDTIDGGTVSGINFNVLFDPETNHPQGYLTDAELEGAGFIARGSGTSPAEFREYEFIFKPSTSLDPLLAHCLDEDTLYTRSSWNSNISLHMGSGCHVKTGRVLDSGNVSLLHYGYGPLFNECKGLFLESGRAFIAKENIVDNSGDYAGLGDFNLLANSGVNNDYIFTIAAPESGDINVTQRFLTGNKVLNSGENLKDFLQGFEITYVDDQTLDSEGLNTDRLVFSSYDNDSYSTNHFMLMKKPNSASDKGVFGINNFDHEGAGFSLTPATIFNVRSDTNAEARITAENAGDVSSALQLLTGNNCVSDGLEVKYDSVDKLGSITIYQTTSGVMATAISESGYVGICSSGVGELSELLTIGGSGHPSGVIKMHEVMDDNLTINPIYDSGFGRLYVKYDFIPNRSQKLQFLDSSGNIATVTRSRFDSQDNLVFTDTMDSGNTFAGILSPLNRSAVSGVRNTAYGYGALSGILTGSNNVAVGFRSAEGIATGSGNTVIGSSSSKSSAIGSGNIVVGHNSANGFTLASGNTILGNNNVNTLSVGSGNIFLGSNINSNAANMNVISIGNNLPAIGDNGFQIGNNNDITVSGLHGSYAMTAKGATLMAEDPTRTEYLKFTHDMIEAEIKDSYRVPYELHLKFTGSGLNGSHDLMTFDHSAPEMSGVEFAPSFEAPSVARPFASLSGDLKLLGAVRFRDGTSVETNALPALSGMVPFAVEGFMKTAIATPSSYASPTSGILEIEPSNERIYIVNRDKNLHISSGDFVVALNINSQYRPIFINNEDIACGSCCK